MTPDVRAVQQAVLLAQAQARKIDPTLSGLKVPPPGLTPPGILGDRAPGLGRDTNALNRADGGKDVRKAMMLARGDVGKTLPESARTLHLQRQALLAGKRKAMLFPKGGNKESVVAPGMERMETPDGVIHYNPGMVSEREIAQAVKSRRLNEVLGLGPYSKNDVAKRVMQGQKPVAVVARDAGGNEAAAALGTQQTAPEQVPHIAAQMPAGGSLGLENPAETILRRAEGGEVGEPIEQDTPAATAEMQHKAEPLEYSEAGFGLHQFVNNNIGFAGGARMGKFGTDGTHRLGYSVYDLTHPSGKPVSVGKAELNFHPETKRIEGIINLEFDKKYRGMGYGTRAVKALAASNPEGLQVYDIKKSAKPFWAKMGGDFRKGDPKKNELAAATNAFIPHEIHKANGGEVDNYIPHGDPDYQANLAKHMEGSVTPHVLYHGAYNHDAPAGSNTRALGDIDHFDRHAAVKTFNRPEGMDAIGSWFSETPGSHNDTHPGAGMYGTSIYPAHVRIKNPWVPASFDHFLDEMHRAAGRDPHVQKPKGRGSVSELRDKLIAAGHDGIYFSEGLDHKNQSPTWVAFEPHQIKSAVGNNGHFDPQEADIRKAGGGEVDEVSELHPGPHNTEGQSRVGLVNFDSVKGHGATPDNGNINYKGFTAMMRPSRFLELARPLETPHKGADDFLQQEIAEGKPVAPPFLHVDFGGEKHGKVRSHDGRHRMRSILALQGDHPVPVHMFGYDGVRAKSLTPQGINQMREKMISQMGDEVRGRNFEDAFHQGKVVTGSEGYADGGSVDDYNTMIGNPDTDGPAGYAAGGEVGDEQQNIKPERAKMSRGKNKEPLDPNSPEAIKKAVAAAKKATTMAFMAENRKRDQPTGIHETSNPKRLQFTGDGPGGVHGINLPRHVWEGGINAQGNHLPGLDIINRARAAVYGSEHRAPLNSMQASAIHKKVLEEHFRKPIAQQMADEEAALAKLRAAKHLSAGATTLDESEKLDTVRHEHDDQGRSHIGYASKGVAGHALYTSGVGADSKFHVLNTCAGQTVGCGGGKDIKGVVDTIHGSCFAPHAEAQYPGAAIKRACHEQAKHDPAMTKDWILAHTGALRSVSNKADKNNQVTLFRPNVVDETDSSSRHVIRGLNAQREAKGLPKIVANSYGKTAEMHDPENSYFVTYSNSGPKVKRAPWPANGTYEIPENISRDKQRVRSTISAMNAGGTHFTNDDGHLTPPKNSYMVTDVQRGSDMDASMQKAFTHAKYWTAGRKQSELASTEKAEGPEGHFGANGEPTTPDKAHYGHTTVNGNRYDYQKQHILHPRLVAVKDSDKGTTHLIPTDSRFKDNDFLPKDRFMSKNGKQAGAILLTTPTTSTSDIEHKSAFTHHIGPENIQHAERNNGEFEIDSPHDQEAAKGNLYQPPRAPGVTQRFAQGGAVGGEDDGDREFPEQSFVAQRHLAHSGGMGDPESARSKPVARMMPHSASNSVTRALQIAARARNGAK